MSPRRKVDAGETPVFVAQPVAPPRDWRLAVRCTAAAVAIAEAITVSILVLVSHVAHQDAKMKTAQVLADVSAFVTAFTSPDPFHANEYVDRILAYGTGEFGKQFREKANMALLAVARGEPSTGTVLDAGLERWNDDGSANVLVVAQIHTKSQDGKQSVDAASRWLVTAQKEGDAWKISSLVQVV